MLSRFRRGKLDPHGLKEFKSSTQASPRSHPDFFPRPRRLLSAGPAQPLNHARSTSTPRRRQSILSPPSSAVPMLFIFRKGARHVFVTVAFLHRRLLL